MGHRKNATMREARGGVRVSLAFSCKSGHVVGMPDDPRKTRERIETLLRKALTLTQKLPQSESVQEAAAPYDPASSHYRGMCGVRVIFPTASTPMMDGAPASLSRQRWTD